MVGDVLMQGGMNDLKQSFWTTKAMLLAAVLLVTVFYIPDGLLLWDVWVDTEEFNHGPLMLAVALYLAWKRRAIFLSGSQHISWLGLGLIIVAGAIFLGSIRAGIAPPRHYGYLLMIYGLFLFTGGRKYGNYILPSLLLMAFVIPPPGAVIVDLTWGLQLFSSNLSVEMLRLAGVTVFLDGNVIDLGDMKLEVAEACAGLRYLFPMMGLGILIGMMFDISLVKRAVFLFIASAVAILMNSVRIFMTGFLVDRFDVSVSQDFFHLLDGWGYFVVSFVILLFLCWLVLNKREWGTLGDGLFAIKQADLSDTTPDVAATSVIYGHRYLTALGLVVLMLPLILLSRGAEPVIPERTPFSDFPLKLDERIGRGRTLTQVEIDVLQMTDYFFGEYKGENNDSIALFIGYFEAQSKGQAPHSPRICIPGGGWEIKSLESIEIPHDGKQIPMNRVIISKGDYKQLVYYWFQQSGKSFSSSYMAKLDALWRGIISSRTDGALVRLVTNIGLDGSEQDADRQLTKFAQVTLDVLPAFVPN